ncbi:MAG: hypothetical protein IJT21_10665 [Synergistaceae bacterium]|nr:hypothetical protein [Synergistaceae bacterium]
MSQKIFSALMLIILSCVTACAADESEITFSGNLTVIIDGQETIINGSKNIPMPETFRIETQDDYPAIMAQLFKEGGHVADKAAITVKTSENFTVSGKRVMGVFAIIGTKPQKLLSIGGKKAPYKISAEPGDYYIAIKNTPQEDKEQEELDAAILQYIKISVSL